VEFWRFRGDVEQLKLLDCDLVVAICSSIGHEVGLGRLLLLLLLQF
jgi:hypothetical protein